MRKHFNFGSLDELIRRNWIQELTALGVKKGRNGESFEGMSSGELRSLLVLEQIKNGTDFDIESKANAMF